MNLTIIRGGKKTRSKARVQNLLDFLVVESPFCNFNTLQFARKKKKKKKNRPYLPCCTLR
jgi:hypothetical protein